MKSIFRKIEILSLTFLILFFGACWCDVFAQEKPALPQKGPVAPTGGQEVEQVTVEEEPEEDVERDVRRERKRKEEDPDWSRDVSPDRMVGKRPDPEGTPTKVRISLYIFDIARIRDADQMFTADFRLLIRWKDPRLADPSAKGIRRLDLFAVWQPIVTIMNQRGIAKTFKDEVFVDPDGYVAYVQRYFGDLTVPLNLKDFPRDKHQLYIRARSYYSPEDVELIIDKKLTGWPGVLSIPDWHISEGEARINTNYSRLQDRDMSQIEFSFNIERYLGFYLWKIILPLMLIVFMSWGVFWIDPERIEAQLGLSATSILTLFAFQFAIASLLPRVSYLTRMDKFTLGCAFLIFLALIEGIASFRQASKGRREIAFVLDRFSRVLFPLAFAGIIVYAFVI